jgi:NTE family protein
MEIAGQRKRVGLVLSGGGARAFAHIGLLKALERTGIRVDLVAGTSMGAIIGAFYAAGMSAAEINELAHSVTWRDLIDLSLQGGLLKGEKLAQFLSQHLPADFCELERGLVVTTTDVESGEQVLLTSGDLITAIRASSSFPGAFEPLEYDGRTLADGGIINNLPVDAAAFLGASWMIASNVTPARRASYVSPSEEGTFWERMLATVRLERRNPMLQMMLRSSDIMQSILTDLQYTMHPADVLVKMELPGVRVEAFWQFRSIVDAGEEAAQAVFESHGLLPC